ncbi:MAG: lipid-A-disaccharide synthase [Bacteroidales bacterium]|nr:lipid-A-disaccharide synthase [Bacteroidales bacterium]
MIYFVSAGEASGDLHASHLMAALRQGDPKARFAFLGGDLMAAQAGRPPVVHYRDMAYMGFSEVLRHLPDVARNLRLARRLLERLRPDAVILVDYPSFNLKLAETAYKLGIPVYYFISPKVWAWKEWRVKDLRRYCRRILSILPFEVDFYRRHDMEIDYVGNPSVAEVDERLGLLGDSSQREAWLAEHGLKKGTILALVPGSRRGEIRCNLPVMDEVARRHSYIQTVIAGAPGIEPEFYAQYSKLPVIYDVTFELMAYASVALVTSGTATLECALAGTPQVVCYRSNGSRLAYHLMKPLLSVKYVSLPNLIADQEIVPEMLLHNCTPDAVDARLRELLPGRSARRHQIAGYQRMRQRLGTADAASGAAHLILQDLNHPL